MTSEMRVPSDERTASAIVATRVYEPEGTAAAYRLGALTRALETSGFDVTVLTTRSPHARRSTRSVRRWPVLRDRTGAVRGYVQYASFDVPLFFRLLVSRRPNVVIAEPPPTTGAAVRVACWLRRTPYAYFAADVSSTAARSIGVNAIVVTMLRRLERWVLRGARLVLAVSAAVEDEVIALGARPGSVVNVGTGIDTSQFSLHGPRHETSEPYFVYAGTMSEMQGAMVLLDGFLLSLQSHPHAHLHFFGGGREAQDIATRIAATCPDKATFHGQVDGSTLAEWMRGATAGLASSRPRDGYNYAVSTKALVSLSCGAPVIYAGNGPVREMVTEYGLGWAVPWDARSIADAMTSALTSPLAPGERRRLAGWAAENHSLESVAQRAVSAIISRVAST